MPARARGCIAGRDSGLQRQPCGRLAWVAIPGGRVTDDGAHEQPGWGEMFPLILAGMPIRVNPLYWPAPVTDGPDAIVADWDLVIAGIRKDVTLEPFREGVISDATGKVIQNLMQKDLTAVRATFRAGYYLATPPTGYSLATPCPVGIVKNTGTYSPRTSRRPARMLGGTHRK